MKIFVPELFRAKQSWLKINMNRCLSIMLCMIYLSFQTVCAQSLINTDTFRGPASDQRAYQTGDVLLVYVLENTVARSSAKLDSGRSTGLSSNADFPSYQANASAQIAGMAKGSAETSRYGEVRAQITVRIVDTLPSGLLKISGTQSVVINDEKQKITLSGFIRPSDISTQNTVWSNRIVDADVMLSGIGSVSDTQQRSIIMRIFHWLGL